MGRCCASIIGRGLGRAVDWGTIAEDLPRESNTVTLDTKLTDSDGIAAPRITYRIAERHATMMDFHIERMPSRPTGPRGRRTVVACRCGHQPALLGTARMGDDPAKSVVDPFGRSHDMPNLYVIDGSVFVTAGGGNPTATIAALALRFAEESRDERRFRKCRRDVRAASGLRCSGRRDASCV